MIKIAVIGVGNMGSKYAQILQDGLIDGAQLSALTRVRGAYREILQKSIDGGVPVLGMHSPFEVVSKLDCFMAYKAYRAVFMG